MSGVTTATYIAAASAAASMAGNYIQAKNNNASQTAQYNARNAVQQQGYDQQKQNAADAQGVLQPAIAGFSAPNQQADLGNLITSRANTINANSATPSTGNLPGAVSTAPKVVQDSLANRIGQAVAFNNQQGDALAKVGATGDQAINNNINLGNTGLKINTIDNNARAQVGVNEAEANAAYNNARKSPSSLGSLLSTAGTAGGIASLGMGAGADIGKLITNGFTGAQPGLSDVVTNGLGGLY